MFSIRSIAGGGQLTAGRFSRLALLMAIVAVSLTVLGSQSPAQAAEAVVKVTDHPQLGQILTDGDGMTLYLFKNDRRLQSNCSGGCLTAWPPLLTDENPIAGAGVAASRLTTITRSDGSLQVAFNGYPLYYWQNDSSPGETDGQDRGNVWFVVSPFGSAVHTTVTLDLGDSEFGPMITDDSGRSQYLFTRDELNLSNCNGNCALNWPPLITRNAPVAGDGLTADRLGTIERADGSIQVTYNGKPLYYWFRDSDPGDTLGQEIGRVWYVVSSHGAPIHTVAPVSLAPNSSFGTILTDRSGRTLYLFDRDDPGVSNCAGGCALNWPPFLTTRAPIDIGGVSTSMLGTVEREDGYTQVTVNGSPLYYWQNDTGPGATDGQTRGGVWWVLDANGNKVIAPSPGMQAEQTVTAAAGGTVRSRDGRVAAIIEPGVVTTDRVLRLTNVPTPTTEAGLRGAGILSDSVGLVLADASGDVVAGRLPGPAEVCLTYTGDDASSAPGGAQGLRILQHTGSGSGYWVSLTTTLDLISGQVCGRTSAQGAFALGHAGR